MWYLLACVASPGAISCIAPAEMPSKEVCEMMADNWRGVAQTTNMNSSVRTRCVEVKDASAPAPLTREIKPER